VHYQLFMQLRRLMQKKGKYYGPDGDKELTGFPGPAFINEVAADPGAAEMLWALRKQMLLLGAKQNKTGNGTSAGRPRDVQHRV